jgi:glucosamine--fructose-6-phosphate aminotransferase (isomerizing)
MSGIVGYVGKPGTLQLLLDGLERLAYRGYDSAGVAFQNGKGLEVCKTPGRITDLRQLLPETLPLIGVGLGHTRLATHGVPSAANAHPHTVCGVTVVHNGIIENHRTLRDELETSSLPFLSQTDSEVVPHLIVRYLREGLSIVEAIARAASQLRGTFALGIMHEGTPDTIFAVRNGSPLVLGIGDEARYLASDIPALLPCTSRFVFLEDGHLAVLRKDGMELKAIGSLDDRPIDGRVVSVDCAPSQAEKQGYGHFLLKEIHEQPQGVRNTLLEWVDDTDRLVGELGIVPLIKDLRRLHIAASGSSYHAALVGRYLIEKFVRLPVSVDVASEFRYQSPIISRGTVFVTITQSGETADVLAAQREARAKGAVTFTICNVVGSTAAREAYSVLYTRAGPEIGVASTKAFTAQLAALCLLGIALGVKKRQLHDMEIATLKSFLAELPGIMQKTLGVDTVVRDIAATLVETRSMLVLGRGANYPVALEGALKMKELCYIHAEGYPAGEMKHGPVALIEPGVPVVILATIDGLQEKILSNIDEARSRGGRVIVITDSPAAFREKVDDIITVPSTHPVLVPFVTIVPLQLLAYHIAVLKGCDVDRPRHLIKCAALE